MGNIVDAIEKFLSVPTPDKAEYVIDATPRFEADSTDNISDIDPVKPAEPKQLPSVQELLQKIANNTTKITKVPHIVLVPIDYGGVGNRELYFRSKMPFNKVELVVPILTVGAASTWSASFNIFITKPYNLPVSFSNFQVSAAVGSSSVGSYSTSGIIELPSPATEGYIWRGDSTDWGVTQPFPAQVYLISEPDSI